MARFVIALIIFALYAFVGCSAPTGTRVVTAWGLWAAPFGTPIGLGYWHSAHGENVKSEGSAKPPVVTLTPQSTMPPTPWSSTYQTLPGIMSPDMLMTPVPGTIPHTSLDDTFKFPTIPAIIPR